MSWGKCSCNEEEELEKVSRRMWQLLNKLQDLDMRQTRRRAL